MCCFCSIENPCLDNIDNINIFSCFLLILHWIMTAWPLGWGSKFQSWPIKSQMSPHLSLCPFWSIWMALTILQMTNIGCNHWMARNCSTPGKITFFIHHRNLASNDNVVAIWAWLLPLYCPRKDAIKELSTLIASLQERTCNFSYDWCKSSESWMCHY